MSKEDWQAGKLKHVFIKVGDRKLVPTNFGKCLLDATTTGLCTKEDLAALLGTDVASIKKAGNNLKPREIASISRAIVDGIGVSIAS